MIMTLAVADSIHLLISMIGGMRGGSTKHESIVESLRINMLPVFLTSLTTTTFALIADFLLLPTVLMKIEPARESVVEVSRDEDEDDGFVPGETASQTA